jgi:hypothetical protein
MVSLNMLSKTVLTLFVVVIFSAQAWAGDFPGKGDRLLWGYALEDYDQGNHYLNQQRYEEAIEKYKQAIARYQFDPDFYANLGVAYCKAGDYASAEQTLTRAAELNKKDWMPWSNLANVYVKENKLKEALTAFQKALACNPPPAELPTIKDNIAGISRILAFQKPPATPTVPAGSVKGGKGAGAKGAGAKHGVTGTVGSKTSTSGANGASLPTPPPQQPSPQAERDSLKRSGWDWSY